MLFIVYNIILSLLLSILSVYVYMCMCLCAHVHVCEYMHVCVCACVRVHACMRVCEYYATVYEHIYESKVKIPQLYVRCCTIMYKAASLLEH